MDSASTLTHFVNILIWQMATVSVALADIDQQVTNNAYKKAYHCFHSILLITMISQIGREIASTAKDNLLSIFKQK